MLRDGEKRKFQVNCFELRICKRWKQSRRREVRGSKARVEIETSTDNLDDILTTCLHTLAT